MGKSISLLPITCSTKCPTLPRVKFTFMFDILIVISGVDLGMDVANCYLDGNADVVEFCPHDSYHNILAASTYTLEEGDRPSRSGSISLFNVDADVGQLELIHRVESAGIFDLKWNPVGGNNASPLLAQADADGYLRLNRLESSVDGSELHGISNFHFSGILVCAGLDKGNLICNLAPNRNQ